MKEVLNRKFWQDAKKIFDEAKQEPGNAAIPQSPLPEIERAIEALTTEERHQRFAWLKDRLHPKLLRKQIEIITPN